MAKIRKRIVTYYEFQCPGCGHLHSVIGGCEHWKVDEEANTITPSVLNRNYQFNPETKAYDIEVYRCHLFVTNGKIQYLDDCSHSFAGKTVELPEI